MDGRLKVSDDSDQPVIARPWWRTPKVWVPAVVLAIGLTVGLSVWPQAEPESPGEKPVVDVRVVEHGFTVYPNEDSYWEDSVGYVVENFGNRVAMAEVKYWFVDDDGSPVSTYVALSRPFYVLPGEQVGAGSVARGGMRVGNQARSEVIADVEFEVTAVDVGPVEDYLIEPVAAELTSWTEDVYEYETLDEFVVSLESQYSREQEVASLGLVYRDAAGNITGGWGPHLERRFFDNAEEIPYWDKQVEPFTMPPGHSTVTFGALVPPEFSQGRVDVYASPFITQDPDDLRWKCISCLPDP